MLDRARLLRREMTLPERLLWREMRGRPLVSMPGEPPGLRAEDIE
jgi:very-short-patch-repair endonuclease